MDVTGARFKPAKDGSHRLALCGKTDRNENQTCPSVLGLMCPVSHAGPHTIRVYGIYRKDHHGVYRPTTRAVELEAAGRLPKVRRTTPYGDQGERGGEIVHDFPVKVVCPRCRTLNEIRP